MIVLRLFDSLPHPLPSRTEPSMCSDLQMGEGEGWKEGERRGIGEGKEGERRMGRRGRGEGKEGGLEKG